MLDNIKDGMTSKVGPLPVWAWVGIPAAFYVIWSYYQASQQPEPATATVGGSAGTEAADYGINTGGSYLPSYGAAPNGTSNLPEPEMPEFNNQTWFRQASNWLIGEGLTSTDVVTALNAYLYGTPEEINSTQGEALQRAIMRFGAAPDPAFVPKIGAPEPDESGEWSITRKPGTVSDDINLVRTSEVDSGNISWGEILASGTYEEMSATLRGLGSQVP